MSKIKRPRRNNNKVPPVPLRPTCAIPGTETKIAVMERRVAASYQPHHPSDYRETKENAE